MNEARIGKGALNGAQVVEEVSEWSAVGTRSSGHDIRPSSLCRGKTWILFFLVWWASLRLLGKGYSSLFERNSKYHLNHRSSGTYGSM